MTETKLKIEGMSCQHCVMRLKKALDGLTGVTKADVTVGSAIVEFDDTKVEDADITAAIEKAGYRVTG